MDTIDEKYLKGFNHVYILTEHKPYIEIRSYDFSSKIKYGNCIIKIF